MFSLKTVNNLLALCSKRRYIVRGDSMLPTFRNGQHILVDFMLYVESAPAIGDVVVVSDSIDSDVHSMKRIIGLPGQELKIEDGLIEVDGIYLSEPYLGGLPSTLGPNFQYEKLGPEEFFILGDNRTRSTDSRHFGPIKSGQIVGKVCFRYWPIKYWGKIT